jgi:molecular chaperone DnaK
LPAGGEPAIFKFIRKTVGIDLGTTNSVIALLDAADSALLTGVDENGRATYPSVVGWHPGEGRIVTGYAALALRDTTGTLPLSSVKRCMGLERRFTLGPESLTPVDLSARILCGLREQLARTLADRTYRLDRAVITMPAYFNHDQIEATRRAGELAGFEVAELLHEPTAAAIYYSRVENHDDATYLVYDLGGGTFDVSIIRRRLGDCEVLGVSGDPFLGGDDFDRALATYFVEHGAWSDSHADGSTWNIDRKRRLLPANVAIFDPLTPAGAVNFARLAHVAATMKIQLSDVDRTSRYVPALVRDPDGRSISAELSIERAAFEGLIKDMVSRTINCCQEALARARERAAIRLSDIDYVVLVGGSSRVPLVRQTVRTAFCNLALSERARCPEPLMHEPDLCVAYGAALRAASHGTRYLFPARGTEAAALEIHVTSLACSRDVQFELTGIGRVLSVDENASSRALSVVRDGFSVRIRTTNGLVDEVFLDDRGTFALNVELRPETDNAFELTLCDGAGTEVARLITTVRHSSGARALEPGVLPTQLIVKPLQIEVLDSARRRVKQIVAPVGAPLPGVFRCTCRTRDNAGRVVVPLFEENRVVHELVIDGLDPDLPIGSTVEVELAVDVKHTVTVSVRVQGGADGERRETATVAAAPPAGRPTRADLEELHGRLDEVLEKLAGIVRSRFRVRASQLERDLQEALRYDDEPKAVVRLAELRDLLEQAEAACGQSLDPPWPRFALLVRRCLDLAAELADRSGRERDDLFEHVRAQERYAEQAHAEVNQTLYRECWDNLDKYAAYLDSLCHDTLPGPAQRMLPPDEEAREGLERFRSYLASIWKQARGKDRHDLEARLREVAQQAGGLSVRVKTEPHDVLRAVRRLATEIVKVEEELTGSRRPSDDDAGLLEGPS